MGQSSNTKRKKQRGIYLLPNLLTTGALFAGFYAIVASMNGNFDIAAIAIFIGMIADGLDGRVARLTNTQTPFGAQYDSLSDMIAFGLAPALLMFNYSLSELGKVGWLVAFLYVAATALRLARFNTQVMDKKYFQGLPCPSAAGVVASSVWVAVSYEIASITALLPLAVLSVFISGLMVSSIRYHSFKNIDFKGKVPFVTVVVTVFIITAIAFEPQEMLFGIFGMYGLSGFVITLFQLKKIRKQRRNEHKIKRVNANLG